MEEQKKQPPKKINYELLDKGREQATEIADIAEEWEGVSPGDLAEGLTGKDLPQLDLDNILNRKTVIYGFQMREGMANKDGSAGHFAVIMLRIEGEKEPGILVTGASVVVKKLQKSAKERSLPVSGKFVSCKGKSSKMRYYDFISA
jgi:hypothetical protein